LIATFATVTISSGAAFAECGKVCRAKCQATAIDVPKCIRVWAKINEDPVRAREIEAAVWKLPMAQKFLPLKEKNGW